jgi:hypothetical protein
LGALQIAPEIAQALEKETPIVALESALITHGFAPPANLDIARPNSGPMAHFQPPSPSSTVKHTSGFLKRN